MCEQALKSINTLLPVSTKAVDQLGANTVSSFIVPSVVSALPTVAYSGTF